MNKIIFSSAILLLLCGKVSASDRFNMQLVTENAYKVLLLLGPKSHPEFMPIAQEASGFHDLRLERSGIIDFYYTSSSGKFRGNMYCHYTQLLTYKENVSNVRDTCFRLNIYEFDSTAINGFGKQVGIY